MTNRVRQLILALAITGIAAGAWAQAAPDTAPAGAGPDGPPHGWHHGDRGPGASPQERDERGGHDWGDGGDGYDHHHRHHHGPGLAAFHELNLTPEQRLKMRTIILSARLARLQAMQQAGAHKPGGAPDMAALMNPGDPNYNAAVQAAKKRAADRIQRMSDLKLQLYNVLTPEQKTELTRHIAAWQARLAQRGGDAKAPPAPAAR
jgi:Spy/CpxP family protein refolding chaperone